MKKLQKGKPSKNDRYNVTIDFTKQIEFDIKIHKIQEVMTENGDRIWIDGTSVMNDRRKHLFFYCPSELEYMLRQERIEVGNTIHIKYLGENVVHGSRVKVFYVDKLKNPEFHEQAFIDSD